MLKRAHLKCTTCDWSDPDAIFERNDGAPPCEACGSATVESMDWSVGTPSALALHGTDTNAAVMDFGRYGVAHTLADRERILGRIQKLHPGKRIDIEGPSATRNRIEADEARQEAVDSRKAQGLTEQSWKALKQERKKADADAKARAERKGQDPTKAKSTDQIATTPATKL